MVWLWAAAYAVIKFAVRLRHGGSSWDAVCLCHNVASVVIGALALVRWTEPDALSCHAFSSPSALVLALQLIHSVTDFVFYLPEMLRQPIFIAHHTILIVCSAILPFCPGCYHTVTVMYLVWTTGHPEEWAY